MPIKLPSEKIVTKTAEAVQAAVQANHFGVMQVHNLKETMRFAMKLWFRGMQGGLKNQIDCIKAFSETDFTEDLKKFDMPTLIIHGDDDQIVPIGASAHASSKLVKHPTLKIHPGASHGLADTHKDQLNGDLLAFLKT